MSGPPGTVLLSLTAVRLGYPMVDAIRRAGRRRFHRQWPLYIALESSEHPGGPVVLNEEEIRDVVMRVVQTLGCHHIRTRGTFDYTFLDLHVWFAADPQLYEAHRLSHVCQGSLVEAFSRKSRMRSSTSSRHPLKGTARRSTDRVRSHAWPGKRVIRAAVFNRSQEIRRKKTIIGFLLTSC